VILLSLLQFKKGVVGGAANYISGFVEGMPGYFHYLTRRDDHDSKRFVGARTELQMSFAMGRALRVLSLLAPVDWGYRKWVERLAPDLLLFPQQDIFPRRIEHPKKIVIFVDLIHWVYKNYFPGPRMLLQTMLERSALREAYRVVVISEQTKRELVQYYGVRPEDIYVLYPAIAQRSPTTTGNPIGTDFVLYPANSWPHKRHRFLIEAVREINAKRPRTPITLILTGYVYPGARQLLDLCDGTHIRHLGYVSRATLESLLAHCRFLVFPSEYEGFGIPLVEAMTFGKRILASDIPIFQEIAGDKIDYFAAKEQLKEEMVRLWSENEPSDLRERYAPRLDRFYPEKVCAEFRAYLASLR
jgi:glycosyltransferase involved in cell wall biosynthesis